MKTRTVFAMLIIMVMFIGCSSDSKSLSVSPSSVAFGDVNIGDKVDVDLMIKNKYGKDITISSIVISGSNDITLSNFSVPIALSKNAEQKVTLTYEPMSAGTLNATLLITHDASLKDKTITITGKGIPVARIEMSNTSFDFQKRLINKTHDHVFSIKNIGTADINVSNMTFTGTGASLFSITSGNAPVNVTPGSTHMFTVTFSPVAIGTYSADLVISHNAINETSPITIPIAAEGIDVDPQITLSTGKTWDFGTVATTLPGIQICEIDNSGTDPLTVTSANLTNGTEFSVDSVKDSNGNDVNLPQTIAVGGHILLFVKFAPSAKIVYNDTLSLVHDGTNESSPLDVSLTGTGRDEISKTFNFTGSIDSWVVPAKVGYIRIEAWGGQGGGNSGGKGAQVRGDFIVTPGETLKIIVAENGYVTNQGSAYGAGGGGGSFVYRNASDPLPMIVAGGGGGQSEFTYGNSASGGVGSDTNTATPGAGSGSGAGGTGGNGGDGGSSVGNYSTGGGGCGWLTDGKNGLNIRNPEGKGGKCPKNGAKGGEFTHPSSSYCTGQAGDGGFGGGGGMSDNTGAGGGGGGYNGGPGGNNYLGSGQWGSGGGAGSYNGGANTTGTSGANSGHGKIVITY